MNKHEGIVRTLEFPQIHKIELGGLPPEHKRIQEWGWVKIHDLMSCLSFLDGMRVNSAKDVFARYGLACNKEGDHALLTWVTTEGYVVDSQEEPPFTSDRVIHIPAGWAKRIIRLANSGVVKLTTSPSEFPVIDSDFNEIKGEKEIIHQRVGHKVNGEKIIVLFNGETRGGTTTEAITITKFNC